MSFSSSGGIQNGVGVVAVGLGPGAEAPAVDEATGGGPDDAAPEALGDRDYDLLGDPEQMMQALIEWDYVPSTPAPEND